MTMSDMEWSKDAYRRLGDVLRGERRKLGYRTLKSFQDYLDEMEDKQLSGRTYADIEAGELRRRKRFSSESLAYLEDLFGWAPGATRAILDGRMIDLYTGALTEPGPAKGWPAAPPGYDEEGTDHLFADIDGRLSELEDRVRQIEAMLRPRRPLAAVAHEEDVSIEDEQGHDEFP